MDINPNHTTTIKVQITHIKCVNESTNEIVVINAHGKLNITQSKKFARDKGLTFVSKETTTNEHQVLTSDLLNLIK